MHAWLLALVSNVLGASTAAAVTLPDCFEIETIASGLTDPVALAFAPDDRIFVAEQGGRVWIIDDGHLLPQPFIDLTDEVGDARDRGLLGIAVHPDFAATPWVYLLYAVDPVPGQPDEPPTTPTFGRLSRYLADPETDHTTALLDSRQVLIGNAPGNGFIHCYTSHTVGTVRFANDGTLFVGSGEGAHMDLVDAGGEYPACFNPGLFDSAHDIGAFRAQDINSLAGSILRVDPETGRGLPTNPYWNGDPDNPASKVWAYGLRNPFRFSVGPGLGPGTLYVGDVGWNDFEELNLARGGENFGWPCFEGTDAQPLYTAAEADHHDCTTLETPANPGPVTPPLVTWNHSDVSLSIPPGIRGRCAVGGTVYTGHAFPPAYQGRCFFGDFVNGWIATATADDQGRLTDVGSFATGVNGVVTIETDPETGNLYLARLDGTIRRITYRPDPPDVDRDCDLDLADAGAFLSCVTGDGAEATARCAAFDADDDDDVDLADYHQLSLTGPAR